MIERLLRRTAGEVRVRVTGASLPRFLNACTQGGVRLRRMERVSWDRMDATLSLGDFRKLRSCMGRTGCRVHILKRHGVPFVLARLLPRTAGSGAVRVRSVPHRPAAGVVAPHRGGSVRQKLPGPANAAARPAPDPRPQDRKLPLF